MHLRVRADGIGEGTCACCLITCHHFVTAIMHHALLILCMLFVFPPSLRVHLHLLSFLHSFLPHTSIPFLSFLSFDYNHVLLHVFIPLNMCLSPHPCAYLLVPSTPLLHPSTTCSLSHSLPSYLHDSFNLLLLLQTYTMEGYGPDKGVSPRAVAELFNIVESSKNEWSYALTFSMLEIYNESILDLLDKSPIKVLHCAVLCPTLPTQ